MLLPLQFISVCVDSREEEVAVSGIQDNVVVGDINEVPDSGRAQDVSQRLALGWASQGQQGRQMGRPISTCPVSSCQLPLPCSASGPRLLPRVPLKQLYVLLVHLLIKHNQTLEFDRKNTAVEQWKLVRICSFIICYRFLI